MAPARPRCETRGYRRAIFVPTPPLVWQIRGVEWGWDGTDDGTMQEINVGCDDFTNVPRAESSPFVCR